MSTPYKPPRIKRPFLLRNPLISQVLSGANPLKLFALVGRFAPAGHVGGAKVDPYNTPFAPPGHLGPPTTDPYNSSDTQVVRSGKSQAYSKPITLTILDPLWVTDHADLSPEISLDFIPTTLSYSPVSQVVPIKVVGANNPPYHFGGSEDTLVIKIDWYGYLADPIIKKCRFVESLCKADGWSSGPPPVGINWGIDESQQGGATPDPTYKYQNLFEFHQFVVTKAPYTMKTFTQNKRASNGILTTYNLWPVHATQTITLKRITDHQLTHKEIRSY